MCLVAGRWLNPRSALSRQTLSALLLSYVANAADILDIFTSLQAPQLVHHREVRLVYRLVEPFEKIRSFFVSYMMSFSDPRSFESKTELFFSTSEPLVSY